MYQPCVLENNFDVSLITIMLNSLRSKKKVMFLTSTPYRQVVEVWLHSFLTLVLDGGEFYTAATLSLGWKPSYFLRESRQLRWWWSVGIPRLLCFRIMLQA